MLRSGGNSSFQTLRALLNYAPFEHIQHSAKVVIVGITPGEQQARNALLEARRQLIAGASQAMALSKAKVFASFSGPMRANLVAMLDHVGLHRWARSEQRGRTVG